MIRGHRWVVRAGAPPSGAGLRGARGMRKYWGALFLAVGLCAAPAIAADLPTKKPAPEPIVTPALPSSWHFEITGYGWGTYLAGQAGVGPFPTSPFFINPIKLLEHFQGGLMGAFVARNDTFIGGVDVILARIGAGTNFEGPTSPLSLRPRQPHADRGDRNRLRRVENTGRAAESRALRHGRRSLFLHAHGARLVVSGRRLLAHVRPNEELGRPGRRTRRALRHQRQMVRQLPHRSGRAQQQRDRPGAGLGRIQLDAVDRDDARLSRPLYLRAPDQRTCSTTSAISRGCTGLSPASNIAFSLPGDPLAALPQPIAQFAGCARRGRMPYLSHCTG